MTNLSIAFHTGNISVGDIISLDEQFLNASNQHLKMCQITAKRCDRLIVEPISGGSQVEILPAKHPEADVHSMLMFRFFLMP